MARTQFTFYDSFYRAVSRIKKAADRAKAYDTICAYALYGEAPDIDALPDSVAVAFEAVRPILDSAAKKADAGRKGGDSKKTETPPKQTQATRKQTEANIKQTKADCEQEKEQEKEQVQVQVQEQMLFPPYSPPQTTEEAKNVSSVISDYMNRINPAASRSSLEELAEFAKDMGKDVCIRAFDIALDAKKANWPYIKAILRSKQAQGVKCLSDWEAAEQKRAGAKQQGETAVGVTSSDIENFFATTERIGEI